MAAPSTAPSAGEAGPLQLAGLGRSADTVQELLLSSGGDDDDDDRMSEAEQRERLQRRGRHLARECELVALLAGKVPKELLLSCVELLQQPPDTQGRPSSPPISPVRDMVSLAPARTPLDGFVPIASVLFVNERSRLPAATLPDWCDA